MPFFRFTQNQASRKGPENRLKLNRRRHIGQQEHDNQRNNQEGTTSFQFIHQGNIIGGQEATH